MREHLDDPATALSAAFDVFLTAAAEDPLVRTLLAGEGAYSLLPLVTTQGAAASSRARPSVSRAIILAGWPQVAPADARLLAECLVRLAISYAALPAGPAGMTAASVDDPARAVHRARARAGARYWLTIARSDWRSEPVVASTAVGS